MIEVMKAFFLNKFFFPSVFIALQRKISNDSVFWGVDENQHEFQNGGFLTSASYLIKESITISMEFKETFHKSGDKFFLDKEEN